MIGDRIEQDGQTFEIVGNMHNGWSLIRYVYPASEEVLYMPKLKEEDPDPAVFECEYCGISLPLAVKEFVCKACFSDKTLWPYHLEPYLGDEVFLRKVE